jgi:hypothetical protein
MRLLHIDAGKRIVPCHASTDASCLSFFLSAASRLQLHSGTMRLQACLAERKKYGAILRHFIHDKTLGRIYYGQKGALC